MNFKPITRKHVPRSSWSVFEFARWAGPVALLVAGSSVTSAQRYSFVDDEGRTIIPAASQMKVPPSFVRTPGWKTGVHDGAAIGRKTSQEGLAREPTEVFTIVSQTMFEDPGATWLRLHFSPYDLGAASFVRVQSLTDGTIQDINAFAMANWYDYSAFFSGDALLVELHVAPNDKGVFFEVDSMLSGNPWFENPSEQDEPGIDTLCASDNRIASSELRVGRVRRTDGFTFCSPWLASNGAVLLAGHCLDNDNNGSNELLTAGSVVEFNPPASSTSGVPSPSTAANQYPVDMTDLDWSPSPYAIGSDWAVIGLNPNTTTTARAHPTRGFYRMTRESPPASASIRITGLGDDTSPSGSTGGTNAQSQTTQTSVGPYVGEFSSGSLFWHRYSVDTENSSSGSPVLWRTAGATIAIHTNGGCGSTSGSNQGCSFEHTPLETALRDFVATNAIFVDAGMPTLGSASENGTVFRPYDTVQEAVTAVASGGVLSMVSATYHPASGGTYSISKPMTITAPVGTVYITD